MSKQIRTALQWKALPGKQGHYAEAERRDGRGAVGFTIRVSGKRGKYALAVMDLGPSDAQFTEVAIGSPDTFTALKQYADAWLDDNAMAPVLPEVKPVPDPGEVVTPAEPDRINHSIEFRNHKPRERAAGLKQSGMFPKSLEYPPLDELDFFDWCETLRDICQESGVLLTAGGMVPLIFKHFGDDRAAEGELYARKCVEAFGEAMSPSDARKKLAPKNKPLPPLTELGELLPGLGIPPSQLARWCASQGMRYYNVRRTLEKFGAENVMTFQQVCRHMKFGTLGMELPTLTQAEVDSAALNNQ